jgi:hypothetical protein
MLAGSKKETNVRLAVGLVLMFGSNAIPGTEPGAIMLRGVISLIGFAAFVMGCSSYMKGKGYPWALGFIGLAWIPGLIALFFFPDKYKCCESGGQSCKHGADDGRDERYSRAA